MYRTVARATYVALPCENSPPYCTSSAHAAGELTIAAVIQGVRADGSVRKKYTLHANACTRTFTADAWTHAHLWIFCTVFITRGSIAVSSNSWENSPSCEVWGSKMRPVSLHHMQYQFNIHHFFGTKPDPFLCCLFRTLSLGHPEMTYINTWPVFSVDGSVHSRTQWD